MLGEVLLNDFAQRDLAQPPVAAVEPLERDRRRKSHPARRVPGVSAENYLSTAGDSAMQRTRWAVNVPANETGVGIDGGRADSSGHNRFGMRSNELLARRLGCADGGGVAAEERAEP